MQTVWRYPDLDGQNEHKPDNTGQDDEAEYGLGESMQKTLPYPPASQVGTSVSHSENLSDKITAFSHALDAQDAHVDYLVQVKNVPRVYVALCVKSRADVQIRLY